MISYLFWSFQSYLDKMHLTGYEITSIPNCGSTFPCKEKVLAAKLMRMSSWLQDTSLFQEAWLHVVGGELNWWWSVEICAYTVGVWALYLRIEGGKTKHNSSEDVLNLKTDFLHHYYRSQSILALCMCLYASRSNRRNKRSSKPFQSSHRQS
jgi:hypothetical protein